MAVGDNIKKWRSLRRMTMPQLAEKAGVTAQAVFMWEKGRSAPAASELSAVAAALGVSEAELTGAPRPARPAAASDGDPQSPDGESWGARASRRGDPADRSGFDMTLVSRVYSMVRDECDGASPAELTAAASLLSECLKLIAERGGAV